MFWILDFRMNHWIIRFTHHNWPVAGVDVPFKAESEEEHCSSDARANLRWMRIIKRRIRKDEKAKDEIKDPIMKGYLCF